LGAKTLYSIQDQPLILFLLIYIPRYLVLAVLVLGVDQALLFKGTPPTAPTVTEGFGEEVTATPTRT